MVNCRSDMYAKSYPKKYLKPDHKEKYKTKLDLNSNLEIKKKMI